MHALKRISVLLSVIMVVSGCSFVSEYFRGISTDLYREYGNLDAYLVEEAQEAEEQENERSRTKFYDAADELEETCALLQKSGFKKFFGEILSLGLKIATLNSLPTCEDKIREIQRRFPDYKKSYLVK